MKQILVFIVLIYASSLAIGQIADKDTSKPIDAEVYIGLIRDNFNGFYAIGVGKIKLTEKTDFSIYGLLRGMQFGAGPTIKFFDSKVWVSLLLGMNYGKDLSGVDHEIIGEGIVPSAIVNGIVDRYYFDGMVFLYHPFRGPDKEGNVSLWYWLNGGVSISKFLNLGIHFENLRLISSNVATPESVYAWLGPHVKILFSDRASFRFSGGKDFDAYEYFKIDFTFFIN